MNCPQQRIAAYAAICQRFVLRFDPRMPHEIALDDVTKIDELLALGRSCDMEETFTFIKKRFMVESDEEEAEEMEKKYSDAWLRAALNRD